MPVSILGNLKLALSVAKFWSKSEQNWSYVFANCEIAKQYIIFNLQTSDSVVESNQQIENISFFVQLKLTLI